MSGLAKYEVESVVGEGAYGVVLKCHHRETGEVCAIKKFKGARDAQPKKSNERGYSKAQTAMREVRLLRLLSSAEHIITLREAFRRKGTLYLVFDYAERNMLQLLETFSDGVSEWQARHYTLQLLQAIGWCHANNVIHRDIKPENLLVNSDHSLRLCDFGFATSISTSPEQEPLTDYVATRWYRAPELLLGSTTYGPAVDVWATGCILGELVTGRPMFPGDSEIDQLYIVQKCIGPITAAQQAIFLTNDRFAGYKFPDMSQPEGLQIKTACRLPRLGLEALQAMLSLAPEGRYTAAKLLHHHYFKSPMSPPNLPPPPPRDEHAAAEEEREAFKHEEPPQNEGDEPTGGMPSQTPSPREGAHAHERCDDEYIHPHEPPVQEPPPPTPPTPPTPPLTPSPPREPRTKTSCPPEQEVRTTTSFQSEGPSWEAPSPDAAPAASAPPAATGGHEAGAEAGEAGRRRGRRRWPTDPEGEPSAQGRRARGDVRPVGEGRVDGPTDAEEVACARRTSFAERRLQVEELRQASVQLQARLACSGLLGGMDGARTAAGSGVTGACVLLHTRSSSSGVHEASEASQVHGALPSQQAASRGLIPAPPQQRQQRRHAAPVGGANPSISIWNGAWAPTSCSARPSTANAHHGPSFHASSVHVVPISRRGGTQQRTLPECREGGVRTAAAYGEARSAFTTRSDMDAYDLSVAPYRRYTQSRLSALGTARRERELRSRDAGTAGDRPCRKRRIHTAGPGGRSLHMAYQ